MIWYGIGIGLAIGVIIGIVMGIWLASMVLAADGEAFPRGRR